MARKFLTSIDLNLSELQNAVIQNLASDPSTGNKDGRIYYNTASDSLKIYANGVWIDLGVGDITDIQGTTNEVTVSIVDGVATISLPSTINADTSGNAATSTKWSSARTVSFAGGDVTGSFSVDGSANVDNVALTIAANSVALGTDTTGDYVATIGGTDGVSVSGSGTEGRAATIANTDKGSSQNIFKNIAVDGVTIVADANDDTVTFAGGTGITVSGNATTDTLTITNSGATSIIGTANQIAASSSTGAVTLSLPSAVTFPGTVTLNADPQNALEAATKQYVDNVASGLNLHEPVVAATPATLASITGGSVTYSNGTAGVGATLTLGTALTNLDSVPLTNGARILVKNEAAQANNGVYVWATGGTVLTRASDFDQTSEIKGGDFVFVQGGTANNNTGWVQIETVTLVGTSNIIFDQFSGAGTYSAGNGLTLTGTAFSINTSITADLNTGQTFTNKTLTSPVINNPTVAGLYLSDNSFVVEGTTDAFETTVSFTDPTADRSIIFKDASGTVAYTADITSAINALTTSDIEEGTNLYFTDERAQDAVGNNISGSNSISAVYTDSAGTFAFDTTLATTSYMSKSSGLAVDISALKTKLVTDGFTKKVSASVGNASATSFAVTHNLGTSDVVVDVYDNASLDTVECDVVRTNTNTVTVSFASAPTTNAYRVVVVG